MRVQETESATTILLPSTWTYRVRVALPDYQPVMTLYSISAYFALTEDMLTLPDLYFKGYWYFSKSLYNNH